MLFRENWNVGAFREEHKNDIRRQYPPAVLES
jgi:hypothetical protein